jgi:small GTP-binding protein
MLSRFDISNDEIIPVCVMATMSSGKSTFLNAVLGEEILPEKNEACTARALAVLNKPGTLETKAYICKSDGKKYAVDIFYANTVSQINADENVSDVLIVKDIPTLTNSRSSIVLFDTPGVNNSGDIRHAERTKEILDQLDKGIIVYLLNATQLATNDDEMLLQMVIAHAKKKQNVKIMFVLNKIDMLDEDKESIPDTIKNATQYIRDHGLTEFGIFPLSALSAKTFRMALNGKNLTKAEQRHMNQSYQEYQDESKSMLQYISSYNQKNKDFTMGDKKVSEYALRRAIENTGIVEIEREIDRLIMLLEQKAPKNIDKLSAYAELEGVYSRKRKTRNPAGYSGKIFWICKKCKQVNGIDQICLYCKQPNVMWKAFS